MDKLEPLSSIARLSQRVVRVLGQNPGKFTLQGTNTYIVGTENPYILIDTAEGRAEYESVLESALRDTAKPLNASRPDVSDIVISHWHLDHVGGIAQVLTLLRKLWRDRNPDSPFVPPRLHKFPSSKPNPGSELPAILKGIPPELYAPSREGTSQVFHDLSEGQILSSSSSTLRVLHTPGHTDDSICLHVPEDKALYTADTVLGQGTAVFEDLAQYMSSLRRMLAFNTNSESSATTAERYSVLYPGHGPVVTNGAKTIETYIAHRMEREEQIVRLLSTQPDPPHQYWSTWTLVSKIYAKYPENLWLPAARGVGLHLAKLEGEKRVQNMGGEGVDTLWKLLDNEYESTRL